MIIDLSDNDDLLIYGDESDRLVLSGRGTRLEDVNIEGTASAHYVSDTGADLSVEQTIAVDISGLVT